MRKGAAKMAIKFRLNGFRQFQQDDSGAAAIGYALVVSLVSVAIIGLYQEFGESVATMFDNVTLILRTIDGLMTEGLAFAD